MLLLAASASACRDKAAAPGAPVDAGAQARSSLGAPRVFNADAPRPDKPLGVGDTVYDFVALSHIGRRIKLSEFGERPVLVYFCPADTEPACKDLALSIRDSWLALQPQLSMVLGVTVEPTVVHREFATKQDLPQLLIADGRGRLRETFGLPKGAYVSYLVGKDRKVLRVFSPPQGKQHAAAIVQALRELELLQPPFPM